MCELGSLQSGLAVMATMIAWSIQPARRLDSMIFIPFDDLPMY
jgi:hypothetical protein